MGLAATTLHSTDDYQDDEIALNSLFSDEEKKRLEQVMDDVLESDDLWDDILEMDDVWDEPFLIY